MGVVVVVVDDCSGVVATMSALRTEFYIFPGVNLCIFAESGSLYWQRTMMLEFQFATCVWS